jgi:electron transport complex protein RnfD
LVAAVPALLAGTFLFGLRALFVCGLAIAAALVGEGICQALARRYPSGRARRGQRMQACAVGMLLALTLPVTVGWEVPVVGALAGIVIGKALLGGLGNFLWHPTLVGRAIVQLLFGPQVAPQQWPFLAKGHLLTGSTAVGADAMEYFGCSAASTPPPGIEAWSMRRPIDSLIDCCYGSGIEPSAAGAGQEAGSLLELFRDYLPSWSDTLLGHVGGGIGETCVPALALGGLLLTWRGAIRWRLPVAALVTVGVLAALWPINIPVGAPQAGNPASSRWLPLSACEDGFPVGVGLVLYHLTGGGLWLACLLVATDPISTPLTSRGQIVFGIGLGALTMVARCNPFFPGLAGGVYWAILGMNTLVPLIDRLSARRVLGTSRASVSSALKKHPMKSPGQLPSAGQAD